MSRKKSIENRMSVSPNSRYVWGPLVWRLYHTMAEISHRRDITILWRRVLQHTARTMPCALCRNHLGEYLRIHPFMKIEHKSGTDVRNQVRKELWILHNDVNQRLGKPEFPEDDLATTKTRDELMSEIQTLFNTIQDIWSKQVHISISPHAFYQWKKTVRTLIVFLRCGPN